MDGSERSSEAARSRSEQRAASHPRRRGAPVRRGFAATEKTLDALASAGARVSVRVSDLDRGTPVLVGDDFVTLPVAGLGIVPLLIEVAARFEAGSLDPLEIVDRSAGDEVGIAGLWRHLAAPALPLTSS